MKWKFIFLLTYSYFSLVVTGNSQQRVTDNWSEIQISYLRPEIPEKYLDLPKGKSNPTQLTRNSLKEYKERSKDLISRKQYDGKYFNCNFERSIKVHYSNNKNKPNRRQRGIKKYCEICRRRH